MNQDPIWKTNTGEMIRIESPTEREIMIMEKSGWLKYKTVDEFFEDAQLI
jgi:hypothetical protein